MRLQDAISATGLTKHQIYHAIDKKWINPMNKGNARFFNGYEIKKLKIVRIGRVLNMPDDEIYEALVYFSKFASMPIDMMVRGDAAVKSMSETISELTVF